MTIAIMTKDTTLSRSYQLTIPSEMRKRMGWKAADPVTLELREDGIFAKKAETREEKIRRIFRELDELKVEREKRMTPEQKEFAKKTKGWTASQYREFYDDLPETKARNRKKYGF